VIRVFIDGQAGTTGLQIAERLKDRPDIHRLDIPEAERKNPKIRQEYLNSADLVILCLPDEAARESVALIDNPRVKILDASSAHRTHTDWVYGLPELEPGQRQRIAEASRVSNPGCYPTGFILALAPLVRAGLVPPDYPVTVNAISGYSGGGRQLMTRFRERPQSTCDGSWSCRKYGFQLKHKHLPEMQRYTGLHHLPLFEPAVADVEQGMLVSIPLLHRLLKKGTEMDRIWQLLNETYREEPFIEVLPANPFESLNDGFLSLTDCNGSNRVQLLVFGHSDQTVIVARLDNLGKGASGAAIQNLNLMSSLPESRGLDHSQAQAR